MKLKNYIILFACVLTLGGCAAKESVQNAPVVMQATSDQSLDVRDFLDAYMQIFNSRDMENLVSLYSPDTSVLVFAEDEAYVLHKDELLSAFEMKKDAWTNKGLQFVGYDLNNVSVLNNKLQVNVAFHVNSASWNGKYPTSFQLKEMVSKDGLKHYYIEKENM